MVYTSVVSQNASIGHTTTSSHNL